MNFQNDDDLSDGSNDSFFEDPKILSKRTSIPRTPEKKIVSDLFNLTDENERRRKDPVQKDDLFSSLDSTIKGATLPKKKQISFDDDDDILGTMGFDKKKVAAPTENVPKTIKKSDILESILAPKQEEKKNISFEDILKDSKVASRRDQTVNKLESNVATTKPSQPFSLSEPVREGRRARRPSGSLVDPLGLFETATRSDESNKPEPERKVAQVESKDVIQPQAKKEQSKSASNISDLPDWLGGAQSKVSKSEPLVSHTATPEISNAQTAKKTEVQKDTHDDIKLQESASLDFGSIESNEMFSTYLKGQKIAQSDMEIQNSFLALQQQESQLLMALQLKKYEESLTGIQKQQQEVLVKQEKQFNIILDRYLNKQQTMESNMRLQQERINNQIQMLISNVPSLKSEVSESSEKIQKMADEEAIGLHEKIVESLKTRHNEELFIMEESYKKQIFLLEQSIEKLEERFKQDMNSLSESYEEKIAKIKSTHSEEIKSFEERYRKLEEIHKLDLDKMRENHMRVIEDIKNEHATQLEVLKQMKDYENNLYKDSNVYSQKLDQSIDILSTNSQVIRNLQENMHEKFSVLTVARENSLLAKEKEASLMKDALEKCRESAELERSQLLGLVRNLELKIAEQNNSSREERWALQQASSTLAARTAALDREFEFNKTSIEREREQLKTLREAMLAEQEKIILQLNEEKLSIASERSRLETSAKLSTNFDTQKSKAEIEAAIQVAKESAEMTDRERANLQRQQIELEKLKRTVADKERKLEEKEQELQSLTFEAQRKSQEAQTAINESKTVEAKCKERMKELQARLYSMSTREKKLSEEKIALSKERLMMYTAMRQKKKCGLCEADNNLNNESQFQNDMINVFEDEGNRIRFDFNEEEKNSEVSKEEPFFGYN